MENLKKLSGQLKDEYISTIISLLKITGDINELTRVRSFTINIDNSSISKIRLYLNADTFREEIHAFHRWINDPDYAHGIVVNDINIFKYNNLVNLHDLVLFLQARIARKEKRKLWKRKSILPEKSKKHSK